MSSQRRTAEFNDVKVRGLRWQNPDGSFPAEGDVLTTINEKGETGWTPGGGVIIHHPDGSPALQPQPLIIETGRITSTGGPVTQNFSQLQGGTVFYKTQTQITGGIPAYSWTPTGFSMAGSGGYDWMAVGALMVSTPSPVDQSVYILGNYANNLSFYNKDGTQTINTLPTPGPSAVFLTKYNTEGVAQWIATIDSTSSPDIGYGMTVDKDGNVYIIGAYRNAVLKPYNADGTGSSFNLSPIGTANNTFLIKYNSLGYVQWATRIASLTSSSVQGFGVTLDKTGSYVYISGIYTTGTSVTFYNIGDISGQTLTKSIDDTIFTFLAKYDSNGICSWAAQMGDTTTIGNSLITDLHGDIYITGIYTNGDIQLYNRTGQPSNISRPVSVDGADIFLAKYNADGFAQWVSKLGSSGNNNTIFNISSDRSNGIFLAGTYNSPLGVFNSTGTTSVFNLPLDGTSDAFIVKYNSSGNAQWARKIGGTGIVSGRGVTVDLSGNCYVNGSYNATPLKVYAEDNITISLSLLNVAEQDAYIVKYNSTGTPQWVRRIGGAGLDGGVSITADKNGNVYTMGTFLSNPLSVYNADDTIALTIIPVGGIPSLYPNMFLVKYISSGAPQWGAWAENPSIIVQSKIAVPYFMDL
jgi:hypothetical protein